MSHTIQWMFLVHVDYVELIAIFVYTVHVVIAWDIHGIEAHFEVEPVTIALSVSVLSQIKVILALSNTHDFIEVASFKKGIEDQWLWKELLLVETWALKILERRMEGLSTRFQVDIGRVIEVVELLFETFMHFQRVPRPKPLIDLVR